ncbi:hypothetical protein [Ascidiimonas aurantiaca]|uniref:hypothetical protein n=1 Tax=Ascidiimonas aurantiaca TaxID=1685432 RepID=UPI0030EB55EF
MKKKHLKGLMLRKSQISSLNVDKLTGGGSEFASCLSYTTQTCVETRDAGCSNHMCDSRLGGCKTYYCPILM